MSDAPVHAPEDLSTDVDGVPLVDLLPVVTAAGGRVAEAAGMESALVRVITLADGDSPEEQGALILSPGPPPDPLPEGCVALVCRATPAKAPSVPVVVLAPGAPWGPLVADLSAALAVGSARSPRGRIRAAFRSALIDATGYTSLARVGADLLGAGVVCLDEYLDVLGAAALDTAAEAALEDAVERARGHGPASPLGAFVADESLDASVEPVIGRGGTVGVVVTWAPAPLSGTHRDVLDELAEACAIERARDEARAETEARLRGDLLEELRAGEEPSPESVVRRARHLGTDLSSGAVAVIGKLEDPHNAGRLITDSRLVRRFMQQVRAVLELHCPGALTEWDEGHLLALLPPNAESDESPEERSQTVARRLIGATGKAVPGVALSLALSRHTADPSRLGSALDEAQLALAIGERLGRVGEIVTFEETGTYKLLFQIFADRPEELHAFYGQTIAPLVAYDEQYGTELVTTLATYLENDANLAGTASRLFTHRHTVRYRLDRIADLAGLDISRTDDREKLSLGLKAMRLLGKSAPTPPLAERGRGRRR